MPSPRHTVILVNLGGPSTLDDVKPFLLSLFRDPAILSIPLPWRDWLARFIAWRRTPVAQTIYRHLGGGSPILANTRAQAHALEQTLRSRDSSTEWKVLVAMQHSAPHLEDVLHQTRDSACGTITILPLYPQFSTTTTGSAMRVVQSILGDDSRRHDVCCYPTHHGFIQAMAEKIAPRWQEACAYATAHSTPAPRLLLSAHGLPEKTVNAGDPYPRQCAATASALRAALGLTADNAVLCYQSRVGPLKWTQPATDSEIRRAGAQGIPLVIAPLAFVSEHVETLVEIDQEYRTLAHESGVPWYGYTGTVSTHPAFIEGLVDVISRREAQRCMAQTRATCSGCPFPVTHPATHQEYAVATHGAPLPSHQNAQSPPDQGGHS